METTMNNSALVIVAICLIAMLVVMATPLDNVAPAHLSQHALERHGADAQRVYDDWCGGCETYVFRNLARNEVRRVVCCLDGSAGLICNTTSGLFGTVFKHRKPAAQLVRELEAAGWEFMGVEIKCK